MLRPERIITPVIISRGAAGPAYLWSLAIRAVGEVPVLNPEEYKIWSARSDRGTFPDRGTFRLGLGVGLDLRGY